MRRRSPLNPAQPTTPAGAPRAWTLGAGLLALSLLVARPMHAGAGGLELAAWVAIVAGFVLLPGFALLRALAAERDETVTELGLAAIGGLAVLVAADSALRVLGLERAIVALPVVAAVVLAFAARRSRGEGPRSALDRRVLAALLVLAGFVALRTPIFTNARFDAPIEVDLWFHAGNVAALTRGLPMEDPRIAGEPLVYHFFAYVPFAIANELAGIPVEALVQRVAASSFPLLLLVQTYSAARAISGKPWAGVFAAAFVMLHEDVGFQLRPLAPGLFGELDVHSYLKLGVYHSPTTCLGLAAFATLARLLHRWFERGNSADLVLATLVGALASGSKGSVMPVVLAGLGATVAWNLLARDRAGRAIAALVALGLAAAPMTLWISSGETGYARAMFGLQPFATARVVGFIRSFAEEQGVLDVARFAPLVPVWLVMYVGVSGWIGASAAWIRRRALQPSERWLAACVASGISAACLVAASGESQLFFAYNGNVALAILAGGALANGTLSRRARNVLIAIGAVPMLVAVAAALARTWKHDFEELPPDPPRREALLAAFRWIRVNAPEDAVVVARRFGLHGSVVGERSAFYETEAFTANHYGLARKSGWDLARIKLGEGPTYYVERERAMDAFFSAPSSAAADAILRQIEPGRAAWFVVDRIRGAAFPELDAGRFPVVHENELVRIHAAKGG